MLGLLFANARRSAVAFLRNAGWAQLTVIAAFAIIGAAIFVGSFAFFLRAFNVLLAVPDAGPLIIRYVLETAFAFVCFLGIASFVASSRSFFYRGEELRLLFSMPVDPSTVYAYRFFAATAASSWPTLLIAVPALAALGVALGAGAEYAAFSACVIVLFLLAIAVTGALISFAFAPIGRRFSPLARWCLGASAFVAAALALLRLTIPRSVFTLFEITNAMELEAASRRMDVMFVWLPSHPFARAAASVVDPTSASVAGGLLFAAITLVTLIAVLFRIAANVYLPLWQSYGERTFVAGPADVRPLRRVGSFPRIFRIGHGFLLEKDLIMLLRDENDLARAGFFALLLGFSVLSMRAVALAAGIDHGPMFPTMLALAFAVVAYFVLTFGLRFVFPSFSREGAANRTVFSSPIHAHEFFSWKFFFWSAVLVAISLPAMFGVITLFAVPAQLASFLMLVMTLAAITITSIALGQGTVFPSFGESDPDKIATSPAGLVATGIGFLYIMIAYRYVRDVAVTYQETGIVEPQALFGIMIVSFAVIGAYWAWASRSLDQREAGI